MIRLETHPEPPPENVERFIVEIHGDVEISEAFDAIRLITKQGRVSKTAGRKHHCHSVRVEFKDKTKGTVVCIPNKKSERFVVWSESKSSGES